MNRNNIHKYKYKFNTKLHLDYHQIDRIANTDQNHWLTLWFSVVVLVIRLVEQKNGFAQSNKKRSVKFEINVVNMVMFIGVISTCSCVSPISSQYHWVGHRTRKKNLIKIMHKNTKLNFCNYMYTIKISNKYDWGTQKAGVR